MRRPPGIALDAATLVRLADLLAPYVAQEDLRLSETYRWKIPDGAPVAPFNTCSLIY